MAQTERSYADNMALLADNSSADVSQEDLRDALASMTGYGAMILTVAGAPATLNSVGTSYLLLDVFDAISAQSSAVNTAGTVATLSPTYDLVLGATGIYRVDFWASVSSSANNKLLTFRPHLNGNLGIVEVDRWISTGSDTGVIAFNGIISYSIGDKIDIRVKIDAGTTNLTFLAAGFSAFRVG